MPMTECADVFSGIYFTQNSKYESDLTAAKQMPERGKLMKTNTFRIHLNYTVKIRRKKKQHFCVLLMMYGRKSVLMVGNWTMTKRRILQILLCG